MTDRDEPLTFEDILKEEQKAFGAILNSELAGIDGIFDIIYKEERTALCLSGGGIRSAAFSLGVIQKFSELKIRGRKVSETPLLSEFDYLSTVSGGGYTGSWISAWLMRNKKHVCVTDQLHERTGNAEAEPIRNLRRNSLYLARQSGLLSADLWSDISSVIRNLFLNWILIISPFAAAILLVNLGSEYYLSAIKFSDTLELQTSAFVMAVISLGYTALHLPTRGLRRVHLTSFFFTDGILWLVAALLALLCVPQSISLLVLLAGGKVLFVAASCCLWALVYGAIWIATWCYSFSDKILRAASAAPHRKEDAFAWTGPVGFIIAGAAFGLAVSCTFLGLSYLYVKLAPIVAIALLAALGPPLLTASRLIGDAILAAGSERVNDADVNFEWLSRAGGYFLKWLGAWAIFGSLIMFGPSVIRYLLSLGISAIPISAGTLISGLASALMGSASATGPSTLLSSVRKTFSLDQLASIFAILFVGGFTVLLSTFFDTLFLSGRFYWLCDLCAKPSNVPGAYFTLAGLLVLTFVASITVNVNRFSMHGLYRNRLTRTFLAASRSREERDETRDKFSDYDGHDSPLMCELWPNKSSDGLGAVSAESDWRPFHVINVTANLAKPRNLSLQERKAASFTISPLHAGSAELWAKRTMAANAAKPGAYRETGASAKRRYGGSVGLSLGTAMAISGAAVSPNMGYYTSPGISLLMTLFNVRLGWWLANPSNKKVNFTRTGPTFALEPLFREMFDLTNEEDSWLLLSDGGHFDNTGLYEMIRRRCKFIVVVDGGADPTYTFSDLGRTLMKIGIDFGIKIDFPEIGELVPRSSDHLMPGHDSPYWATGKILYPEIGGNVCDGIILYIKAGLHGTEPLGTLSYGLTHPEFPHDSTINQFYGESQFEAYRSLGYEIAEKALTKGIAKSTAEKKPMTLPNILHALGERSRDGVMAGRD